MPNRPERRAFRQAWIADEPGFGESDPASGKLSAEAAIGSLVRGIGHKSTSPAAAGIDHRNGTHDHLQRRIRGVPGIFRRQLEGAQHSPDAGVLFSLS